MIGYHIKSVRDFKVIVNKKVSYHIELVSQISVFVKFFLVQCGYRVHKRNGITLLWYCFSEVSVKVRGTDFSTHGIYKTAK